MLGRGSHIRQNDKLSGSMPRVFSRTSSGAKGYTITEVMIFLAVTSGIFAMVATTFNQRQKNTEFSTAAREVESQVQDIANDISTGYAASGGNIRCVVTSGVPTITSDPTQQQGTNDQCILVGRVIHFVVGGSSGEFYDTYSVAGARRAGIGTANEHDVVDYTEARPRAITQSRQSIRLPKGLIVKGMKSGASDIQGVGFFTTFGGGVSANPSALSINLIPLTETGGGSSQVRMQNAIGWIDNGTAINPPNGVTVCMDGDGTNQRALLKIGTQSSRLTTEVVMESGACAAIGY